MLRKHNLPKRKFEITTIANSPYLLKSLLNHAFTTKHDMKEPSYSTATSSKRFN